MSCFVPPLAAVLQRASLPGGLLFIAASPRLRRGHVAARLRASASTCVILFVEGRTQSSIAAPSYQRAETLRLQAPSYRHAYGRCLRRFRCRRQVSLFPRPVLRCRRQGTAPCETSSMHTLPLWVGSWPLELMGYTRRLRAQNRLTLLFSHTFTSRSIHPLLSTRAQLPISLRSSTFQGKLLSV